MSVHTIKRSWLFWGPGETLTCVNTYVELRDIQVTRGSSSSLSARPEMWNLMLVESQVSGDPKVSSQDPSQLVHFHGLCLDFLGHPMSSYSAWPHSCLWVPFKGNFNTHLNLSFLSWVSLWSFYSEGRKSLKRWDLLMAVILPLNHLFICSFIHSNI